MNLPFPRTLILGWDGASPELLDELVAGGSMPHVAELRRRGSWGPLRSTLPPMTLPAWTSFLCGVPPGDHGILDFFTRSGDVLRPITARDRLVPTILRRLSDQGLRVTCLLFPASWPPEPLTGEMISGFDSPVATTVPRSACHPPGLWDELPALAGGSLRYAEMDELRRRVGWEDAAREGLLRGIRRKERLALSLLASRPPPDVFALLFGESDTASHHFWDLHDPRSPRHDPKRAALWGDVVRQVYCALDRSLGALLAAGPPFESVVIASDHGFGAASNRVLHLHNVLAEAGFLRWSGGGGLRQARSMIATTIPGPILDRLIRAVPAPWLARAEGQARWEGIDLSASAVVSDELNYAPSLWLRQPTRGPWVGRSQSEITDAVECVLLALRDPKDGAAVVQRVIRREEAFPGPAMERAPHLFLDLMPVDGGASWVVLPSHPGDPAITRLPSDAQAGTKGWGMAGSHRPDGVFVLLAPGAPEGPDSMAIHELLPRWLELLGRTLGPSEAQQAPPGARGDISALRGRLRDLGYVP